MKYIRLIALTIITLVAFMMPLNVHKATADGQLPFKGATLLPAVQLTTRQPIKGLETIYIAPRAPIGCQDAKSCIYFHESGDSTTSVNPVSHSCGLGQAWPCSKMPCSLTDYTCQDNFFTQYMLSRYGSWDAAWAYWEANSNW